MGLAHYVQRVKRCDLLKEMGRIEKIVGIMIESLGPKAKIGDVCKIKALDRSKEVLAEVVGIREGRVLLMPYDDIKGIGTGSVVETTDHKLLIPVGEGLKGRLLNGIGQPLDEKGPIMDAQYYSVEKEYSNPLSRPRIQEPISLGVKAIDGMLTLGKGQRVGIFAGSGVGKSTLMGMIAKNVKADVNVIALVGERGREVLDFIEKDLGPEGMKRSVLIVATSDQPAMIRSKCALVATTIAEYFKDQGQDVLLMMDSLTRYAQAQREIGLATGEPPVARGYTPSIYSDLPKLLERSGNFNQGSITGIYTVLVEGDDTNEPISDTVRGILDGHIILSRALAEKNHYPAIDVNASVSRLMNDIAAEEHLELAHKLREMLSMYYANYDLISIGAYKEGTNPRLDDAMKKINSINGFLQQKVNEKIDIAEAIRQMQIAIG